MRLCLESFLAHQPVGRGIGVGRVEGGPSYKSYVPWSLLMWTLLGKEFLTDVIKLRVSKRSHP